MEIWKKYIGLIGLAVSLTIIGGCGSSSETESQSLLLPLEVESTSPEDESTVEDATIKVEARFNQSLDENLLSPSWLTLQCGGGNMPGTRELFTPDGGEPNSGIRLQSFRALRSGVNAQASVDEVKGLEGQRLEEPFTWSFSSQGEGFLMDAQRIDQVDGNDVTRLLALGNKAGHTLTLWSQDLEDSSDFRDIWYRYADPCSSTTNPALLPLDPGSEVLNFFSGAMDELGNVLLMAYRTSGSWYPVAAYFDAGTDTWSGWVDLPGGSDSPPINEIAIQWAEDGSAYAAWLYRDIGGFAKIRAARFDPESGWETAASPEYPAPIGRRSWENIVDLDLTPTEEGATVVFALEEAGIMDTKKRLLSLDYDKETSSWSPSAFRLGEVVGAASATDLSDVSVLKYEEGKILLVAQGEDDQDLYMIHRQDGVWDDGFENFTDSNGTNFSPILRLLAPGQPMLVWNSNGRSGGEARYEYVSAYMKTNGGWSDWLAIIAKEDRFLLVRDMDTNEEGHAFAVWKENDEDVEETYATFFDLETKTWADPTEVLRLEDRDSRGNLLSCTIDVTGKATVLIGTPTSLTDFTIQAYMAELKQD